jgi:hypothetical protein
MWSVWAQHLTSVSMSPGCSSRHSEGEKQREWKQNRKLGKIRPSDRWTPA